MSAAMTSSSPWPVGQDFDGPVTIIKKLIDTFTQEAASLYDDEARRQGFIVATDRLGEQRQFPLLSVSAALVNLPSPRGALSPRRTVPGRSPA